MTVFVDGQEVVTFLCTPQNLHYLILGYLYFQGLIRRVEDVASITVCPDEPIAQVRLTAGHGALPRPQTIFSGCGSGLAVSPHRSLSPLQSPLTVKAEDLLSLMGDLLGSAQLYRAHGGLHISGLAEGDQFLVVAEDIGRHNTLDKIQGECLHRGLSTRDRVLLTTGRLSSEMVEKAALMEVPILASRNSPTERAAAIAEGLGMTLVGYLRGPSLSVYTHPERVQGLGPG